MPEVEADKALIDPVLRKEIEALTDEERKVLSETVAPLMADLRARIEYAEGRRGALATVAGVLLAAGLAGLLQVSKGDGWDYFPARLGLLILVVGWVGTGSLVLWIWGRQTNWNYPYKAVSKTWKHFYRDAIPHAGEPRVAWNASLRKEFSATKARQFSEGRLGFVQRTLALTDASLSLGQDIEQMYLLHWTDLYKNQFLSALRKVLVRGVLGTIVAAAIGLAVAAALAGDLYENDGRVESSITTSSPGPTKTSTVTDGGATVVTTCRVPTSTVSDQEKTSTTCGQATTVTTLKK